MTAKIFVKDNETLRIEGDVTTNGDIKLSECHHVVMLCDGIQSKDRPSVFVDKSVFPRFKKVEITGGLILVND